MAASFQQRGGAASLQLAHASKQSCTWGSSSARAWITCLDSFCSKGLTHLQAYSKAWLSYIGAWKALHCPLSHSSEKICPGYHAYREQAGLAGLRSGTVYGSPHHPFYSLFSICNLLMHRACAVSGRCLMYHDMLNVFSWCWNTLSTILRTVTGHL